MVFKANSLFCAHMSVTSGRLRGMYGIPSIKTALITYKVSALYALLSLWSMLLHILLLYVGSSEIVHGTRIITWHVQNPEF